MEGEGSNNYKFCRKNLAPHLGVHVTDGCGEFILADETSPIDASMLLCASCGCHRSFHWKEQPEIAWASPLSIKTMPNEPMTPLAATETFTMVRPRKRERTKFTSEQKERMWSMAESLGWKISNNRSEEDFERFSSEVGVSRKVFKVWMHNHRNEAPKTPVGATASSVASESTGGATATPDATSTMVALVP